MLIQLKQMNLLWKLVKNYTLSNININDRTRLGSAPSIGSTSKTQPASSEESNYQTTIFYADDGRHHKLGAFHWGIFNGGSDDDAARADVGK